MLVRPQLVKVTWTSRPALLLERGEQVSVVQWQDTKSIQAIGNDQIGDPMDFSKMTRAELVSTFNEMSLTAKDLSLSGFNTVKQFRDTPTGVKRCMALHAAIQKVKKPVSVSAVRKSAFDGSGKITVIAEENPKRGKAKERFAYYKNGMLVSTYIEKVGDEKLANADLRWDVKQKFISIS